MDNEGEAALNSTILSAKANKITTIIITHRTAVASVCDKILLFKDGELKEVESRKS